MTTFLRRLVRAVVVVLLATLLVSAMADLVPGDAAEVVAGENASQEKVEQVRVQLGLDKPMIVRFVDWAGGAVTGDFGQSLISGRSVGRMILDALPATLSITLLAALIGAALGVTAGLVAGLRQGRLTDRLVTTASTLGIAMPGFWIGMILVSVFALDLGWLPATGFRPLSEGVGTWLRHLILPASALGIAMAAEVARQTRGGVVDVMEQSYIRTARVKGMSMAGLIRHHVVRNAAIPVVTVLGMQLGRLLGGVIVIEQVFGVAGLGTLAVNSVLRRDFPVLQTYVLITTIIVVGINLLVDSSYSWINPRTRSR